MNQPLRRRDNAHPLGHIKTFYPPKHPDYLSHQHRRSPAQVPTPLSPQLSAIKSINIEEARVLIVDGRLPHALLLRY